ncbi:hypothetical protein CEUSTIGMA_g8215.t1 [Chlamydomonas eustigma]|uniref:ABC transporter domain-containing protein n=1 Tax=Chlamydomonas eustigma TaxID=1157962 RepID=A0A250XD13_9CHLO|nr:hypothetical protein CEUSTIGMA_g8215.t1 [Chlamydomonas eustigma]|eukprot:GAX80779.1 hypothetical protein CEUSTIGMA_g8215.t1 [Chlamydomonas eustigma]
MQVTSNSAAHLLLLVFLSNTSLVAMGMTFSTFVQRSSLAVPLSFAVFIIAWVLQLVVSFGFPYNASNSSLTSGISLLFDLFPWTLLSKGILDLAAASSGQWQTGISWSRRSSYCWDGNPPPAVQQDTSQYWQANCHMPLGQIYWVLLVQACAYLSAAVYLDCVLPGGEHAPQPQPWYFLFRPVYSLLMMCGRHTRKHQVVTVNAKRLQQALIHEPQAGAEDADVAEEAEATRQQCISYCTASTASQMSLSATDPHLHPHAQPPSALDALSNDQYQDLTKTGLYLFGLQKTYSKRIIGCSTSLQRLMPSFRWGARQPQSQQSMVPASTGVTMSSTSQSGTPFHDHGGHVAVAGVWLRIPEGQCFCLLGPNGAGKTTTLKCLTGAQIPTGGDALVYGHSVCSDEGMQAARSITGVCPQFDVLWGELTAREHMLLYADVKGLPWSQRTQAASELLDKVGLTESADRTVGNFSGGMKRRLSVAMALLGDPRVVYLDEPTTGMDPVSRRQVWDLISACKCNRVVILTTHSMEEADVLGDRIGILASGRLRCLGTSLHLKNRFGSGYQLRLTLACQQQQQQQHAHSKVVTSQDEEGSSRTVEVYEGQPQRGDMFPEMLTESMSSKLHILEERLKEYFGDQVKIIRGGGKATDVLGGGGERESDMTESHLQNDSHNDLNNDGGPQPSSDVPDGWPSAPMFSVATEASSSVVWTVMVSQDHEQALLCFLEWSKESGESVCGIKDIQLCLTPLEEVYLKVVRLSQAG